MKTPDPERLFHETPAFVKRLSDEKDTFVADVKILDSGWLRAIGWDGTRYKIPPQNIEYVEYAELEKNETELNHEETPRKLADPKHLDLAKGNDSEVSHDPRA
jgi:hypothetical protein